MLLRKPKKRKNFTAVKMQLIYLSISIETPTDAAGDDRSSCPAMEGFLKKLNSQGVWKDRYCQLQNGYFMTYKPKDKKGPSNEVCAI